MGPGMTESQYYYDYPERDDVDPDEAEAYEQERADLANDDRAVEDQHDD